VQLQRIGDTARYVLVLGNRLLEVLVEEGTQGFALQIGGRTYDVETVRKRRGRGDEGDSFVGGRWTLVAPLTGVVVEVRVTPGQQVAQNDVLVVVEAMKMLNELRARVAGEVGAVHIAERDRVEIGARLIEVTETASDATP
jgi:acetyl/propionyl-CoA carboxylase alpha subunit